MSNKKPYSFYVNTPAARARGPPRVSRVYTRVYTRVCWPRGTAAMLPAAYERDGVRAALGERFWHAGRKRFATIVGFKPGAYKLPFLAECATAGGGRARCAFAPADIAAQRGDGTGARSPRAAASDTSSQAARPKKKRKRAKRRREDAARPAAAVIAEAAADPAAVSGESAGEARAAERGAESEDAPPPPLLLGACACCFAFDERPAHERTLWARDWEIARAITHELSG